MQVCTLLLLCTVACTQSITGDAEPSAPAGSAAGSGTTQAPSANPTDYDQEILDVATNYKSAAFTKINASAYASSLAGIGQINVYVYGDALTYKTIHPETATTTRVGVGTVVVREVLDGTGAIASITMIAKAPSGFDDTLGDWWFGEADANMTIKMESGIAQVGRVSACHSCHVPREAEDYLFGVPVANQKTNGGGGH